MCVALIFVLWKINWKYSNRAFTVFWHTLYTNSSSKPKNSQSLVILFASNSHDMWIEAAIILDGFKSSISTHNIIYGKVIGDGDSSVYNKIKDAKPYGPDFFIEKIECRNHILRNFCNKLKEICKLPRTSAVLKNKIKSNILKLRTAIVSAIKYRKNEQCPLHEKIENLKNDILNSPRHILGNHSNCAPYFCTTGNSMLLVCI